MYNSKIIPLVLNLEQLHNRQIEIEESGGLYDITDLIHHNAKITVKHYFFNNGDYKIIFFDDACISIVRVEYTNETI